MRLSPRRESPGTGMGLHLKMWGSPGVHITMTCANNMQTAGKVQVVQLPRLHNVMSSASIESNVTK